MSNEWWNHSAFQCHESDLWMQRFITSVGKNFLQSFFWSGVLHSSFIWSPLCTRFSLIALSLFLVVLADLSQFICSCFSTLWFDAFFSHPIVNIFLFIVQQPATVSRCGMIYLEPASLGWDPVLQSWLNSLPELLRGEQTKLLNALFHWALPACLTFVRKHCKVMKYLGTLGSITLDCL